MAHQQTTPSLFGLMAEFPSATALVAAARRAREAGFTRLDAFSPYPIPELDDALKLPRNRVPLACLGGGLLGLLFGYSLQYATSATQCVAAACPEWLPTALTGYPLNIGGRPFHSMPAFIVPAYETTILFAAFGAVIGMIALNGLPRPYHPVFNVEAFAGASSDKFFLTVEAADPTFDLQGTRQFLEGLHPVGVFDIAS